MPMIPFGVARKGAAGTGHFHQRPNGTWELALMADGKRYSASGKTQGEARRKLKAKLEAKPVMPTGTVAEFLSDWLEHSAKGRVGASTFVRYEQLVRVHIVPGLGSMTVADLRPVHVERFLSTIDRAPQTRRHVRAVLRTALTYAIKTEVTTINAAGLADAPKMTKVEVEPMTVEAARAFLEAARAEPLYALYVMALYTGMRQGELLGLRWSDIDLEEGTVAVRRGIRRVRGTIQDIPTKTAQSRRVIPLLPVVVEALRAHQVRQRDEDSKLAGARWNHRGHVFTTTLGTPMDSSLFNMRHYWPLRARVGLPSTVRFHHLRHTTASLLLDAGVPMQIVSTILGHASITMTVNTYGHTSLDALRAGLERLPL